MERWLDTLPQEVRTGRACLLLQGALDWAAGHQADAVASLREAVGGYTEAGDLIGMWLARFALADPLFVTGGIEEVVDLAEGFDAEPALAAGFTPPAVAVYAAARWPRSAGWPSATSCRAARGASPFRRGPAVARRWECYTHLLSGRFAELLPAAESAIREFKRSDPFSRLAVVSAVLPFALADQGRDAEALAGWRDVEERVARRAPARCSKSASSGRACFTPAR